MSSFAHCPNHCVNTVTAPVTVPRSAIHSFIFRSHLDMYEVDAIDARCYFWLTSVGACP